MPQRTRLWNRALGRAAAKPGGTSAAGGLPARDAGPAQCGPAPHTPPAAPQQRGGITHVEPVRFRGGAAGSRRVPCLPPPVVSPSRLAPPPQLRAGGFAENNRSCQGNSARGACAQESGAGGAERRTRKGSASCRGGLASTPSSIFPPESRGLQGCAVALYGLRERACAVGALAVETRQA